MLKRVLHLAWLATVAALLLIAVSLTTLRLWIPSLSEYRDDVEQAASTVLGRTVTVGRMQATWRGLHPVLKLKDVLIAVPDAPQQALPVAELWVRLDVLHFLRTRKLQVSGIDVIGADLVLVRTAAGEIYLEKFRRQNAAAGGDAMAGLTGLARLSVHESSITFRDALSAVPLRRFSAVMLSITKHGEQYRLSGHAYLPADVGYRVEIDAQFSSANSDFRDLQGRAYLQGRQLSVPALLQPWLTEQRAQGIADMRLWIDVDQQQIVAVSGELELRELLIENTVNGQSRALSVDSMGVQLDWQRQDTAWQSVVRLLSASQSGRQWQPFELSLAGGQTGDGEYLRLSAAQLPLDDLWQLLPAVAVLDPQRFLSLQAVTTGGQLDELDVRLLRSDGEFQVDRINAQFNALSVSQGDDEMSVTGLEGAISSSAESGTLTLHSRDVMAANARLFRKPLSFDELQGDINWSRTSQDFRFESERLQLVNADMALQAAFALVRPHAADSSQLDLDINVESLDVGRVSHYLPAKVMPQKGVAWLDRSLLGGQVRAGTVQLHGRLDQLPFDHGEGQFEVRLPVTAAILDFNPDWTPIKQLDAQVNFTGRQMDITSQAGLIRSASLQQVHAQIKDLRRPYLTIKGKVNGGLPVMLAELGSSPLGEKYGGFVDRAEATGTCNLQLDIGIPLSGPKDQEITVAGRIKLHNNGLAIRDTDIALAGITGELQFDDDGIEGDELQVRLFDRPAVARVWGEPSTPDTHISLRGPLALFDTLLDAQDPLRQAISGDSDWQVELTLRGTPLRGQSADAGLRVSSMLAGSAIDLPAPLGKPAGELRRFTFEIDKLEGKEQRVALAYGDTLKGRLLLDKRNDTPALKRGMITFGGGAASLPDEAGLLLNGSLPRLSLSAWQSWLTDGETSQSVPLRFDLGIGELELMGYYLDDLQLAAASVGRNWQVTASGANSQGEIELTESAGGLEKVVMNMQRLTLRKPATTAKAKDNDVTPADMPALQITIGELIYNGTNFGQLDLRAAVQSDNKLVLDHLALSSPLLSMRLTGAWGMTGAAHHSQVELEISKGRMGTLLDALGYEKVIKNGELFGSMQASWPAPLWDFSPATMNGKFNVIIKDGQLLDIEPGAPGRALGLLSLGKLPKRLTLDFSDLFGDGFGFNRISGNFVLDDGNAYTNDLVIDGPAAKIDITGRVGLAMKEYDELVTVTPYLNSSLPLAGALAGGPAVGAAVIVADKLLGDKLGLNKIASKQYTVTGGWDAPEVKRVNTADEQDKVEVIDEDIE